MSELGKALTKKNCKLLSHCLSWCYKEMHTNPMSITISITKQVIYNRNNYEVKKLKLKVLVHFLAVN